MSENQNKPKVQNNPFILEYLLKVKSAMPGWIKGNGQIRHDVLEEIEQHLLDKIDEFAKGNPITDTHIQKAIAAMGTPELIMAEYKRRGTPKIYISKELWPIYLQRLIGLVIIIIFLSILSLIGSSESQTSGEFILVFIHSIWTTILQFAFVLTIIFVVLSMDGYLPEDLGSRRKISENARKDSLKGNMRNSPLKLQSTLIGGFIEMIIGNFLIIQPTIDVKVLSTPTTQMYLRIMGILLLISAMLHIFRGLLGNRKLIYHQGVMLTNICVSILWYPLLYIMATNVYNLIPNPEIFSDNLLNQFKNIFYIIMVFITIGIISDIIGVFTLKTKYNQYLKELEN